LRPYSVRANRRWSKIRLAGILILLIGVPFGAFSAAFHGRDFVFELALGVDRTHEDLDASASGAAWTGLLAELGAAVDAGEELIERDA
jgi:hypothetical protein